MKEYKIELRVKAEDDITQDEITNAIQEATDERSWLFETDVIFVIEVHETQEHAK